MVIEMLPTRLVLHQELLSVHRILRLILYTPAISDRIKILYAPHQTVSDVCV